MWGGQSLSLPHWLTMKIAVKNIYSFNSFILKCKWLQSEYSCQWLIGGWHEVNKDRENKGNYGNEGWAEGLERKRKRYERCLWPTELRLVADNSNSYLTMFTVQPLSLWIVTATTLVVIIRSNLPMRNMGTKGLSNSPEVTKWSLKFSFV